MGFMQAGMHIGMSVHVYACTCADVGSCMHICTCMCEVHGACVCIGVLHMHVCTCVCRCGEVCMYVWGTCVCMYIV